MTYNKQNTVDYFPHQVIHGRKMFIVRKLYGNDGYAVWFLLLEELGKAHNHYIDLSDNTQILYLSAKFDVSAELFFNIMKTFSDLDIIDKELWDEVKIIYSSKFFDSIKIVYGRRKNEVMQHSDIRAKFLKSCKQDLQISIPDLEKDDNTQHSKEEESKGKKSSKTLFCNSTIDYKITRDKFLKDKDFIKKYIGIDLKAYIESVSLWSDTSNTKRTERGWFSTIKQFIKGDHEKGNLIMLPKKEVKQKGHTNF